MAAKKVGLDSIRKSIAGLASRIPFLKRGFAPSPEPFSTIEDETPLGDLLSSQNAAHLAPAKKGGFEKPDFHGLFQSAVKHTPVLVGMLATLALLVITIVVAVATSLPPRAPKEAKAFTKEGEALVKQWLPPPGDPLEARMEMERVGVAIHSATDAARIGTPSDPGVLAGLIEKNNEAIEDLYGTVP